jgi:GNAT superfamily N-acetyltransferase
MATKLDEQIEIALPEGFTVRGATLEDVDASLEMYNLWSQRVIGEDDITDAAAIRNEWVSPGFDPAEDIRLVFAPDGKLVSYMEVWTNGKPPVHPWIWGRVHPDYSGLGIGSWLLTWAEQRAARVLDKVPADLRVAPRIGIYSQAEESQKLFKNFGYQYIRSSYRMMIDLESPPPEPVWPDGLTIRTYNPKSDARAIYLADQDAFRDHLSASYILRPNMKALTLPCGGWHLMAMKSLVFACAARILMTTLNWGMWVRWVYAVPGANVDLVLPFCITLLANSTGVANAKPAWVWMPRT